MLAWYTSHVISEKIMLSVARGWKIPAKHTSLFTKATKNNFKDEAILYGILRGCSDVIHHNFKSGLSYLHLDNGYLKRHHFTGYYRISLNDTQAHYKDIDLPAERFAKLGIKLKEWRKNDQGLILIVPPTEAFAIFYGIDVKKWIDTTIKKIVGAPYKIREKSDLTPIEEDFKNTKCLITFNSNSALEAIIAGVPAIATSEHSVVRDWNKLTMADIADCYDKSVVLDRNKLMNFVAYHQFTLDEVEKGIAAAIIKEMRKENVY